jgi:hypothetical protein
MYEFGGFIADDGNGNERQSLVNSKMKPTKILNMAAVESMVCDMLVDFDLFLIFSCLSSQ